MSKHKFLFKHSVFYNNSKSGQLQTWTDLDTVTRGQVDESVGCAKEGQVESLGDSQLSESSVTWTGQYPLHYLNFPSTPDCPDDCAFPTPTAYAGPPAYNNGPEGDQGDCHLFSPAPVSALTTLTSAVPGIENLSYFDCNKPSYGCDYFPQNQLSNNLAFPGSISWNLHADLACGDPQSNSAGFATDGNSLNVREHPCGEADDCWNTSDRVDSSLETHPNISGSKVDSPVCELPNTTSVIKTSNRVGVITKAPSQTSKPPAGALHIDGDKTENRRSGNTPNSNIIVHESEGVVSYECRVCRKKFKSKSNWKYHVHSINGVRFPYTCELCGKGMFASTHYRYHLLTHSGERPYKCNTCSKGFFTVAKLERHVLIHNEEKLQKCKECPKAFHLLSELRCHELIHKGEQPYTCQFCEKKFVIASLLKSHELIHTGQQKYICETCGKRFQRQKHLDNHVLTHTGAKPFRCEKCNKCFRTEASHSHHMKTHDDERPYRCSTCGRAFLLEKDYNRHQNVHSGIAPFSCTQCERTFRRKDNLIRHNKIYHLEGKQDGNVSSIRT